MNDDWTVPKYELDYSRYVDKTQEQLTIFDAKLTLLDKAVAMNKMKNPYVAMMIHSSPLLYLKFFYDLELRWYQDMFITDNHPYKIFVGANQVIGKSFTMGAKALFNFDRDWGYAHNEAIISASKDQAKYQMGRIKDWQKLSKFDTERDKEEDNVFIIKKAINDEHGKYKYSNRIIVAPFSVGSLGYDIHKLNLDEFDFWETDTDYAFNQFLQPRTYETMKLGRAQINIYSNPNGESSFMHKLTRQQLPSGEYKWHTYVFNYWDSPGSNKDDFEVKSVGLTKRQIESTLLGIFSTGERSYFTNEEITESYSEELENKKHIANVGKNTYWFLDVGATHDQSVLTAGYIEPDTDKPELNHFYLTTVHKYPVGYPIARVVGSTSDVMEHDGWHYEKSVREYLEENKQGGTLPVFGCDVTGNSGISPLFQAIGIIPTDIQFTGPAKSGMYQRFKYLMEKRLIHRIKDDDWKNQAIWLIAEKSARGYLMIHNINHFQKKGLHKGVKSQTDLDDCMDSTAGCIHLSLPYDQIEPSMIVW